jgi:hypothetical protein
MRSAGGRYKHGVDSDAHDPDLEQRQLHGTTAEDHDSRHRSGAQRLTA